jgi:hypothetical protein
MALVSLSARLIFASNSNSDNVGGVMMGRENRRKQAASEKQIIPIIALVISSVTAALMLNQNAHRNRFEELDKVCTRQDREINAIKLLHAETNRRLTEC